ncbi:glycosyltransferase [Acuticoccus kandeliae]|uniref:glycosyltransferase n=1 Tax=Acuticoccus kandeliae TaxID=2073160 RepID=UPI000D3EDBF5|nr:glycosyltransferase [Acuticoccus kandeliae]
MRVAHVTSQVCRRSAGLGTAVAAISAATAAAGNEVRVFGLASPGWWENDSAAWKGAPATVFDTARWSGPLGYAPDLLPALLDFDPDVVHLHGLWTYPSIAAYRWHRKTGRALVVSAHGMLMPPSLSYKPGRKKLARRLFQDRVLSAAAVLHTTSADEAAAYGALGFRGRTVQIPLGLDTVTRPEVGRDGTRQRVLFLGRLHHQKGLDWLIEAWTGLERDFPDWSLSIVGPTDEGYARAVAALRKDAEDRRVSFLEPIYGDQKFRYIAGSDLLVMPSRSENFGLSVAEALMMEVPVIATHGTPWSGLVDNDAGWWIEPAAAALKTALRTAMAMPAEVRSEKGRNGRRWIERDFSRPVIGARWQDVYQGLVNRDA